MTHFSGSWKTKQFKPYNFDARGAPPTCGHLHPLMKVRAEIRQIFLEMGWVAIATCHINLPHPQFISLHPSFPLSPLTLSPLPPSPLLPFVPPFLHSFTEMPTNNFIESSFWNFDALFQPQQHPARDAHDTFFLKGQPTSIVHQ